MKSQIKGPAVFLAQVAQDDAPFNSLEGLANWCADMGYKGIQIPTFDGRVFDVDKAFDSATYCDEVKGICADAGVEITEFSTHLQGQLVAVHPAYDKLFDAFAPEKVHNNPKARQEWAVDQVTKVAKISERFGLERSVSFSGSLAFPYLYPWPPQIPELIDEAFTELAKRWQPILDAYEDAGCYVGYEIHPGEDLFDGTTFEMFLDKLNGHKRCTINYDPSHFVLQQLDYLSFIDIYHERITSFHVKDAEFNPTGRQGVYSGYQNWTERAGRFRSVGDGQVDFKAIFAKLTQYGYDYWAVLEWECCLKSAEQGLRESVDYINSYLIEPPQYAFDDFADGDGDGRKVAKQILGIDYYNYSVPFGAENKEK